MDTYTLHSAFLDSLRPPLRCEGGQPARLASPAAACYMCGEPLIAQEIGGYDRITCNNWRCLLYREGQGCRPNTTATWPVQAIGIFYQK